MSLVAYRSALKARLAAAFPGVDVDTHGGRFTIESLKTFTVKAPAIRVATMGLGKGVRRSDGSREVPVISAVYIVTKDVPTKTRDTQALEMLDSLFGLIEGENFIIAQPPAFFARLAQVTKAENLYDNDIQGLAVALWAVAFEQPLVLAAGPSEFEDVYPLGDDVDAPFEFESLTAGSPTNPTPVYPDAGDDEE